MASIGQVHRGCLADGSAQLKDRILWWSVGHRRHICEWKACGLQMTQYLRAELVKSFAERPGAFA